MDYLGRKLWLKHGRIKLCFAPAAVIRVESLYVCVFVCIEQVNGSTSTDTAKQIQRKGEKYVSVFTRTQKLLSVSRSRVGNVRGACLHSARGVRA